MMADGRLGVRRPFVTILSAAPRFETKAKTTGYMESLFPRKSGGYRKLWGLLGLLAVGLMNGCYDGSALLKQAQSTALSTTLAEVDLGTFQTTLPRDPDTGRFMSVDLHIFGTVPRSRLSAVQRQLGSDEYRMRHETLSAVRQSTSEELSDPTFTKLRTRLEQVVNKVLADSPIKEVGFYQLTLR
jgi:hypothetical protein